MIADRDGVGVTEKVPGVCSKSVCPATFLMDDTRKFASVVIPGCLRLASEAPDTTKCRIL